ncbi:MAG: hypothetical protein AB7T49_08460 [Oligoflexales bacterium]
MIKLLKIVPAILTTASFLPFAYAETEKSPESKAANQPESKMETVEKAAPPATTPALDFCAPLLNPLVGDVIYLEDKQKLIVFKKVKDTTTGDHALHFHYNLLEINTKTLKSKLLSSMTFEKTPYFMIPDYPITTMLLVSFKESLPPCPSGEARSTGISLLPQAKIIAQGKNEFFHFFASRKGSMLARPGASLEVDPATLQTRSLFAFPREETPLYFDRSKQFLSWDGKNRILKQATTSPAYETVRTLQVDPSESLLIAGTNVAVGSIEDKENVLTLNFLQEDRAQWKKGEEKKIGIETQFPLRKAAFAYSGNNLLAIFGREPKRSKLWEKMFISDIQTGKKVAELNLSKGRYVSAVVFSDGGKKAFAFIHNSTDHNLVAVNVWSQATSKWQEVYLTLL